MTVTPDAVIGAVHQEDDAVYQRLESLCLDYLMELEQRSGSQDLEERSVILLNVAQVWDAVTNHHWSLKGVQHGEKEAG